MQYPIYYMKYIGYCIGRIYVRKAPKKKLLEKKPGNINFGKKVLNF